jgi:thiamine biosynthesis lipoprotein
MPAPPPAPVTLALHAMATRFELALHGDNPAQLRAAGEEALREVERLEAQLSFYRPTSEISRLNSLAATEPVRVEPGLFRFLQLALQLCRETGGAFDITVAPLMRAWGFTQGAGRLPDPAALAEARACTGWRHVLLDERDFTVRFARAGVMLDLGALGKGFALERASGLLRENGVTSALLHGGTSTVVALGAPPGADSWKVAIEKPPPADGPAPALHESVLATVPLRDEAMSVSAVWGKSFTVDAREYGHVIDPRTGEPTRGARLAAVALPSAAETDAFSTALLTLGIEGLDRITSLRPAMRTLIVAEDAGPTGQRIASRGVELQP